jgi:hypothetical protein
MSVIHYPFGVSQIAGEASLDELFGAPLFDGAESYQAVSALIPEPQLE